MKANYTPSNRVYSSRDITEANEIVKHYHTSIEKVATDEFRNAVMRETADSVAEEMTEEALLLIKELCLDQKSLGAAVEKLKHNLANEFSRQDITDSQSNRQWITSRGSDLAMAVTTFWLSLDKDPSERRRQCSKLIRELNDNCENPEQEKAELILSRFFIDRKGVIRLLQLINSRPNSPIEKSRESFNIEHKNPTAPPVHDPVNNKQAGSVYH